MDHGVNHTTSEVPIQLTMLQSQVGSWHRWRFPEAQREHVGLKLCEEAGEVARAINADVGHNSATGHGNVPEEAADVLISLLVLLDRWYPETDLLAEATKKLSILLDSTSGHRVHNLL